LPTPIAWAITFLFVMLAWVFFRSPSLADAMSMLRAMAGMNLGAAGQSWLVELAAALTPSGQTSALWVGTILLAALAVAALRRNSNTMVREFRPDWRSGLAVTAGLIASVLQLGKVTPFIYFNF